MPLVHLLDEFIEGSTPGDVVVGIRERVCTGMEPVEAKVVERPLNTETPARLLLHRDAHFPSPIPRDHATTVDVRTRHREGAPFSADAAHRDTMTALNITPFPLFLNLDEAPLYGFDNMQDDATTFAGHDVVGIDKLVPGIGVEEINKYCWLTERVNADAVRTAEGELRFEYTAAQLAVILDLAEENGIRAWDGAAFIAQQAFPDLTILDSMKKPVTTLEALPRHDGVDQRSFHGDSNFPLSVEPPTWFPKSAMPNVTFSWR